MASAGHPGRDPVSLHPRDISENLHRFLQVDKRMVTQMLAAYLEQRDHPGPQQEIMAKMAEAWTQTRRMAGCPGRLETSWDTRNRTSYIIYIHVIFKKTMSARNTLSVLMCVITSVKSIVAVTPLLMRARFCCSLEICFAVADGF